MSEHLELTARQQHGLDRLGDVVIPGDEQLPSFSASGAAAGIGRMLPYMYEADRSGLLALLDVCARLPKTGIRALVSLGSHHSSAPEPLAAALRMANLGIKGVVHSLYWSDLGYGTASVHEVIGYDATINEAAYAAHLEEQK